MKKVLLVLILAIMSLMVLLSSEREVRLDRPGKIDVVAAENRSLQPGGEPCIPGRRHDTALFPYSLA